MNWLPPLLHWLLGVQKSKQRESNNYYQSDCSISFSYCVVVSRWICSRCYYIRYVIDWFFSFLLQCLQQCHWYPWFNTKWSQPLHGPVACCCISVPLLFVLQYLQVGPSFLVCDVYYVLRMVPLHYTGIINQYANFHCVLCVYTMHCISSKRELLLLCVYINSCSS